jgi:hypothetical protein
VRLTHADFRADLDAGDVSERFPHVSQTYETGDAYRSFRLISSNRLMSSARRLLR